MSSVDKLHHLVALLDRSVSNVDGLYSFNDKSISVLKDIALYSKNTELYQIYGKGIRDKFLLNENYSASDVYSIFKKSVSATEDTSMKDALAILILPQVGVILSCA